LPQFESSFTGKDRETAFNGLFSRTTVVSQHQIQGAYNSGKRGNLSEFVHSGKLREFEIYSGNSCISDAVFS